MQQVWTIYWQRAVCDAWKRRKDYSWWNDDTNLPQIVPRLMRWQRWKLENRSHLYRNINQACFFPIFRWYLVSGIRLFDNLWLIYRWRRKRENPLIAGLLLLSIKQTNIRIGKYLLEEDRYRNSAPFGKGLRWFDWHILVGILPMIIKRNLKA